MQISWQELSHEECSTSARDVVEKALRAYLYWRRGGGDRARIEASLSPITYARLQYLGLAPDNCIAVIEHILQTDPPFPTEGTQSRSFSAFLEWIEDCIEHYLEETYLNRSLRYQLSTKLFEDWQKWKRASRTSYRAFDPNIELIKAFVRSRNWQVDVGDLTTEVALRLSQNAQSIRASSPEGFYAWLKKTTVNMRFALWFKKRCQEDPNFAQIAHGVKEACKKCETELIAGFHLWEQGVGVEPIVEKLIKHSSCASFVHETGVKNVVRTVSGKTNRDAFEMYHRERLSGKQRKAEKRREQRSEAKDQDGE